ncbi:MAG: small basic protein [Candidatus Omnitrophica bacterium]|nr:small basic protein [Candidatus Omnitrophota bacterium]
MSIHPSLTISEKDKKVRSVLSRTERIKQMQGKNKWKEGDPVHGLPKLKTLRIKIKKEKVEKAETATPEAGASAAPAAGGAKEAPKAAAPKAAAKGQEKK